jgi:hypothetical protein
MKIELSEFKKLPIEEQYEIVKTYGKHPYCSFFIDRLYCALFDYNILAITFSNLDEIFFQLREYKRSLDSKPKQL